MEQNQPQVEAVEAISVPIWAWAIVAFLAFTIYLLAMDNGAVLAGSAGLVHEFVHDGRHFVGAPCH